MSSCVADSSSPRTASDRDASCRVQEAACQSGKVGLRRTVAVNDVGGWWNGAAENKRECTTEWRLGCMRQYGVQGCRDAAGSRQGVEWVKICKVCA